jgi:hypothetical protein
MPPPRALPLVVALLSCPPLAAAQSPRAGGPAPGDDPGPRVTAELAATGNLARGLIDRDLISARGAISAWSGPWGVYVQPYWLFGRLNTFGPAGKVTTDNEVYVRTGLFRTISGPVFGFLVDVYDHSLRRQIDHRNLLGAGVGASVLQRPGISLLISLGVAGEIAAYRHKLLDDGSATGLPIGNTRTIARSSLRVYGRYKLADSPLSVTHDLIVVPAIGDPTNDYRILFYGALDLPVGGGFSARMQIDATREGLIAPGTKQDDVAITFGLAFKNEWRPSAADAGR